MNDWFVWIFAHSSEYCKLYTKNKLANLKEKYEKDTTSLKDDLKCKSFSIRTL
jgi:hypothetical protein